MAMTMNGEVTLPAERERVWAALNDPEILKSCIPGCEVVLGRAPGCIRVIAPAERHRGPLVP